MKVYIMTDMEGLSGVGRPEYCRPGADLYAEGRRLLTGEINAAAEGCFEGGATEVVVCDGHSGGGNVLVEGMDERIVLDYLTAGRWIGALDGSFDLMMVLGAHAMSGTPNAFLDHTQSSESWYSFSINGREVGEMGQWACMAGAFDVPVVMASGDRAAAEEARAFFGDIETVAVKDAVSRLRAKCMAPKRAFKLIREAARRAMKLKGKIAPFKPGLPIEVVLRLTRADFADEFAHRPGTERIDSRTIRRVVDGPLDIFDIF